MGTDRFKSRSDLQETRRLIVDAANNNSGRNRARIDAPSGWSRFGFFMDDTTIGSIDGQQAGGNFRVTYLDARD